MSGYKPSDMWDAEDNFLFLKYCPSPRDRCYHAMEVDTSARPHELLKLRIKDVEFIDGEGGDGGRYAKIVVNGKTGERALPLIDSTSLNGSLITHKEAIERPYYCLICRLVTIIKRIRDLTK